MKNFLVITKKKKKITIQIDDHCKQAKMIMSEMTGFIVSESKLVKTIVFHCDVVQIISRCNTKIWSVR